MARSGVVYEEVDRVARRLLSKGQHPSVQKVRNILGTGSNTTIANHLKTWQSMFDASHSPVLPESVPDDLMMPLDDFWNTAVARAEANYQNFKEELEAKLETAEANEQLVFNQLAEKTEEFEVLQQLHAVTEGKLKQTEQQFHTLQGEHSVLAKELNHAHSEMERAFTLLQDQNQGFDVEREKDSKKHQEALKYEHERANATESRLLNEIDQLRQNLKANADKQLVQQNEFKNHQSESRQSELSSIQERSELLLQNQQLNAEQNHHQQESEIFKKQLTTVQCQLTQSIETVESLRVAYEQSKNNEIHLTSSITDLKETITQLHSLKVDKKR